MPSLIAIYLSNYLYGLRKTLILSDWLVCEVSRHFVVWLLRLWEKGGGFCGALVGVGGAQLSFGRGQ